MGKTTLRSYNREIEALIDQGHYEEAIAHCRHILSYYNKHISTYRLLGKAYLESQRFGDAADIFQRVLSTIPDDFTSHVGMSIIREDEGNLSDAIWHMERAYEIQPANNAIQRELQRLYGRRDGIEPPKIRLSRGALARMYLKGELYQQAINELRPAQSQVRQRPDLSVLLAQVYFLNGQRGEAAQICGQLIKRLPYCLEANQILAVILLESERAEESKAYHQRVIALEPYAAHTSSNAPTPDEVPDSAVVLEKLDWSPDISPIGLTSQPEWASSLGVDIGEETAGEESLPDWLDSPQDEPTETEETSELVSESPAPIVDTPGSEEIITEPPSKPTPEDTIPEWMHDAGWAPTSGEEDEPSETADFDVDKDLSPEELAPAEIPEWVQAIAPSESTGEDELSSDESPPEIQDDIIAGKTGSLPWLEETPPGPTDTVASWLEEKAPQAPEDAELDLEPGEPVEIPDWLKDLKQEETAVVPASTEDELEVEEILDEVEPETKAREISELPEWLAGGEAVIGAAVVGAVAAASADEDEEPLEIDAEPSPELGDEQQEASIPELLSDSEVQPDTDAEIIAETQPEWLHEFDIEEPVTQLESTESPEPLDTQLGEDLDGGIEAEEIVEIERIVDEELEPELREMQTGVDETESVTDELTEDEEAFAWLEGLAAKQGAEEALLLNPDERQEAPPEWVQKAAGQLDAEGEAEAEKVDRPIADTTPPEIPDWLKSTEAGEPVTEAPAKSKATEIPDWLQEPQAEPVEEGKPLPEPVKAEVEAEQVDEIPDWLKAGAAVAGLAAATTAEEEEITPETTEPVDAILEAEIPELLIETDLGKSEEETVTEAEPTEIPEWFEEVSEEAFEEVEQLSVSVETGAELEIEAGDETPAIAIDDEPEAEVAQLEPEVEMLFGPKILVQETGETEIAESPAELILDEGPETDDDTKPTRITPSVQVPIPPAAMEAPTLEPIETESEAEITAEAIDEELPEWIQDLSEEMELPASEKEPLEEVEAAVETATPTDEIPEWLQVATSEEPLTEEPVEPEPETLTVSEEAGEESLEVEIDAPDDIALDDEDAFAWLEGLAAKHGAEEAMLLEPEERQETPPEWVQQAIEAEEPATLRPDIDAEKIPESELAIEDVFAELEEPAEETTDEVEGLEVELIGLPKVTEEQIVPEILADEAPVEEIKAEEEPEIVEPEVGSEAEVDIIEGLAEEEAVATDTLPELPPWLAGVEAEADAEEAPEWVLPTEISAGEVIEPDAIEVELAPLNINEAGLAELERIPGVGFIKAQAIIEYRESYGPFTSLEDLQNISGVGPSLVDEMKDLIIIEVPEEVDAIEQPTDENQVTIIQARNALIEGDITQSLDHYKILIESQQMLPDVIQDLNEALYRFPVDIKIWQTLGDAHMRKGEIQAALDAYTKAEELLR